MSEDQRGGGDWPGERVLRLRRRLRMSQGEFARWIGVRQQTVSDWETGQHAPQGASRRLLSMLAEERAPYEAGSGTWEDGDDGADSRR